MNYSDREVKDPVTKEPIDWQLRFAWLKEENDRGKYSVEHYVIKWSIENISLLAQSEYKSVSSPPFSFESSHTVWGFKLFPVIICEGKKEMYLGMKRQMDQGPKRVRVTYKFKVDVGNRSGFFEQKQKIFEVLTVDEFYTLAFDALVPSKDSPPKEIDVLIVTCEMYISYPIYQSFEDSLKIADYDLINLSADVLNMLQIKESCDFSINVDDVNMVVHKLILSARSPYFKDILKTESECYRVTDSISNITSLLFFLYSGNFNLVSSSGAPSIGLYECAVKYGVPDLAELLVPNHLNLKSTLRTEDVEFTWHVENLSRRFTDLNIYIRSPSFKGAYNSAPEWTMTIFFKNTAAGLYDMDVTMRSSVEHLNVLRSVLKISLLDDVGNKIVTKVTDKSYKTATSFGFEGFIKNMVITDQGSPFFLGDTLRLHCQWTLVIAGNLYANHRLKYRPDDFFLKSFSRFSQDLLNALTDGQYADMTVKAKNIAMKAHKAVLFSRSSAMSSRFSKTDKSENTVFPMLDVESGLASMIIKHAYSGSLPELGYELLFKVYCGAFNYGFHSLSLICVQKLGSKIRMNNFFDLMILGRRTNNVSLLKKCLEFAKGNVQSILKDKGLTARRREERETNELLANEIPALALE